MDPIGITGSSTIQISDREKALAVRFTTFCTEYLKRSVSDVRKEWFKDPEGVVVRAVQISGKPRAGVVNALREFFPFKEDEPSPPLGFYHLLSTMFPLSEIANPQCLNLNLKKFFKSQMLLRSLALAYFHFRDSHPHASANEWEELLKREQFFVKSGLDKKYQDWFYKTLKSLPDASLRKHVLFDNHAKEMIAYRIYTIGNAAIGVHQPENIYAAIQHQILPSLKTNMLNKVTQFANAFVLDSICMHLRQLEMTEPLSRADFILGLSSCVHHFLAIIQSLACTFYGKKDIDQTDWNNVLTNFKLNDDYNTSTFTCTLFIACLRYFKYQADIYFTVDISSELTESFAHAVIIVSHPVTGEKILIDPTHKQFLKELYHNMSAEWQKSDIWICPLDELNEQLERHLIYRRRILQTSAKKPDKVLFTVSEEEFVRHFRSIYDLSTYTLTRRNYCSEAILAKNPEPTLVKKTEHFLRDCIKAYGLQYIFESRGFQDVVADIENDKGKISNLQLLERLEELPISDLKQFEETLKLDGRVVKTGLLTYAMVGYAMAVRQVVNPNHDPNFKVLYGCSGADVSFPLLATHPGHLYLLDKTPVDMNKLLRALHDLKQAISREDLVNYMRWKKETGAGCARGNMLGIEAKLVIELTSLNADRIEQVSEESDFNGVTLLFHWNYHGEPSRMYRITTICADLQNPASYPRGLKRLIERQEVDIYYQKTAYEIPRHYEQFLPTIAQGIKKTGFLVTTDYDWIGQKYPPEPFLTTPTKRFSQPIDTPFLQAYRKLFDLYLPSSWTLPAGRRKDRSHLPREKYSLFTDIRRKES